MPVATYRCVSCKVSYPFMVEVVWPRLVGGQNSHRMAPHGPDRACTHQVFEVVTDEQAPQGVKAAG